MMSNLHILKSMSDDDLLKAVQIILARPGHYTVDELEELHAINAEFQIRYNQNPN